MRKRNFFLIIVLFVLGAVGGFAQSNEIIDEILNQNALEYSYAVYLILSGAELIPATATPEEALDTLKQQEWNIKIPEKTANITLGEYSYILMKVFNIPGGLMYRLLPGPRYAAREITYLGFISEKTSPYRSISGEEAVQLLSDVLNWKEEQQ